MRVSVRMLGMRWRMRWVMDAWATPRCTRGFPKASLLRRVSCRPQANAFTADNTVGDNAKRTPHIIRQDATWRTATVLPICTAESQRRLCTSISSADALYDSCAACPRAACCNVHVACMLHACCMHVVCMLHACCMHVACMLHACCMHVACMSVVCQQCPLYLDANVALTSAVASRTSTTTNGANET